MKEDTVLMSMSRTITESMKFTDFIMSLVTGDVSNDVATRRARGDEGASISWVVGHLIRHRYRMMGLLGSERVDPFGEKFADGATDGSDYPNIAELRETWNAIAAESLAVVEAASDELLLSSLGGADSPHGEKQILDTAVFLMWHESYHMGQLGTIRTQFGLTPTATLAVEAGGT